MLRKFIFKRHGLKKLSKDERDLDSSKLGWGLGTYIPKKPSSGLVPLSTKNQYRNTCQWNGLSGSKEIDEKIELDEQCAVLLGKREGYISGDGFSNLRDGEIILQKFGCCRKGMLPNIRESWNKYSDISLLTYEVLKDAARHKSKSYWRIYNHNQALQALDEGHPVKLGVGWRTSMNTNGGFSFPWLLNFIKGIFCGGHAIYLFDWDLNYQEKKVFEGKNSFSEKWGDKGNFKITFEDFDREVKGYGSYANIDMDKETAKFVSENNGKVFKEVQGSGVYKIEDGKKRRFADMETLWAWKVADQDILLDIDNVLAELEDGEPMDYFKGDSAQVLHSFFKRLNDKTLDIKSIKQKHPEFKNLE